MNCIHRCVILFLLCSSLTNILYGQTNPNNLQWSETRKLTIDDFLIKTKSGETALSFAQFSVDYQIGGFDFLTKNFNKKVHNYVIKSASSIDTSVNTAQSLLYQQTLFDICEISARQLRKALKDNRKKILKGMEFAKELTNNAMTDFSERRVIYDRETKFGTDLSKQKEWEDQIRKELSELADFAFEK